MRREPVHERDVLAVRKFRVQRARQFRRRRIHQRRHDPGRVGRGMVLKSVSELNAQKAVRHHHSSERPRGTESTMEVAVEYSHPGNDEAEFQLHVSGRRKPGVAVCRSCGTILRATATPGK